MTITTAEIAAWVGSFMWPFLRVGAMLMAAPIFGNMMVPVRVRVLFGVALTIAVMPAVGPAPAVGPLSPEGMMIAFQQVLIGVAMGLLVSLAFQAATIAGESISMTMGLAFAQMADPQTGASVPVLSQFLLIVITLLFLAMGGHLMLIELTAESFRMLPLAPEGLVRQDLFDVISWGSQMFVGALLIALPALAVLLTTNMIIGVMTRAAPQMNIFSVGFPITMLVGYVTVLTLVLPSLSGRMSDLWRAAFMTIRQILET
ncbi:flagellar biosynthetic protein FliR [Ectothiorhodospiraceae bacterium WFHF3C12]|nr:flagellar biosynthetic protein FliR [Ectothiorhodospiraceae bacterium WFHF3C12]